MSANPVIDGYKYDSSVQGHSDADLRPSVEKNACFARFKILLDQQRVFALGCGNGSVSAHATSQGSDVVGVEPLSDGISNANKLYPELDLQISSAYDPLAQKYGTFPAVISLEIVQRVYETHDFAATLFELSEPGGITFLATHTEVTPSTLCLPLQQEWTNTLLPFAGIDKSTFGREARPESFLSKRGFRTYGFRVSADYRR